MGTEDYIYAFVPIHSAVFNVYGLMFEGKINCGKAMMIFELCMEIVGISLPRQPLQVSKH